MKTLVIVHVYYPQLWPELASCIRTIGAGHDLIVTYADESSVTGARRDFPAATFLKCENRGYDIWPFVKALQTVDLGAYDLVVKLHTKRDVPVPYCANDAYLGGSAWRERLLGFVRTPRAWRRTLARLSELEIGMVADRRIVYIGNAQRDDLCVFERALAETERLTGIRVAEGRYVAGSMFAVRAAVLRPLLRDDWTAERFDRASPGNYQSYAHVMERVFGLLVTAADLSVEGYNGSVVRRRAFYAGEGLWNRLGRFVFYRRYVDEEVKIKICGIQIRHRKLRTEVR